MKKIWIVVALMMAALSPGSLSAQEKKSMFDIDAAMGTCQGPFRGYHAGQGKR